MARWVINRYGEMTKDSAITEVAEWENGWGKILDPVLGELAGENKGFRPWLRAEWCRYVRELLKKRRTQDDYKI